MRRLVARHEVRRADVIVPVFVTEGVGQRTPVASMPGVFQMSVDVAAAWLAGLAAEGFGAFIVFGVPDPATKDAAGTEATNADNVVCRLLRRVKQAKLDMVAITDLCLCEYTDHGHCGPLAAGPETVDNDRTLPLLARQAVNHAEAGADVVAPSGMMDGMVAAIRDGLDTVGHTNTAILSYAIKYASAFYGPFRDAAGSTPGFGDRRAYQMAPDAGLDEALRELALDEQQGCDMVMVKPAGPYLDVLSAVRQATRLPVVAYQTSGEYAAVEAAAANGWLDRDRAVHEQLVGIKRAGADLIITYHIETVKHLAPHVRH